MKKNNDVSYEIYRFGFNYLGRRLTFLDADIKGFNVYRIYDGEWINDWPAGIKFIFKGNSKDNFLEGGLHWILLSENVRIIFNQDQIEDVQFLPVQAVHKKTGFTLGTYWAINVIRAVPDLKWQYVHDLDIFRLSTMLFFSGRLKRKIESAKVTSGATFSLIPPAYLDIEGFAK